MNRKSLIISGVYFGIVMALFNTGWNLAVDKQELWPGIGAGVLAGAVSGLLFALLMGWFAKSKYVKNATKLETLPGENILMEAGANLYRGAEAVGGKLYLTSQRLAFIPHRLNIQKQQLSIPLEEIRGVETYKNMGFVNNGLTVSTTTETHKFVVNNVDEWVKAVEEKLIVNNE